MKALQGTALLHSGSKALFFVELFGDSERLNCDMFASCRKNIQ